MIYGRVPMGTVGVMGGVPAVLTRFAWSFAMMVQWNEETLADERRYVHYQMADVSEHAMARNGFCADFLGDWLFMLDTDHTFEPDILTRMIRIADDHAIGVLSGVYQFKRPPYGPVLFQWVPALENPDGRNRAHDAVPLDYPGPVALHSIPHIPLGADPIQIGSAGAGCLLIRRYVIEQIMMNGCEGPFDKRGVFSEDHSFFMRCRENGIPCYATPLVHAHHLRVAEVTPEDCMEGVSLG